MNTQTVPLKSLDPRLSSNALNDFKKIFLKEFGIDLTDSEANRIGLGFLRLFRVVYQPIVRKGGQNAT